MTFTHGGGAGDIIYHLAPIKALGGGELWLNRSMARIAAEGEAYGLARMESLLTLLRVQPYIRSCGLTDEIRGLNLDGWRDRHVVPMVNLSDQMSNYLGIPHVSRTDPWLSLPSVQRVAAVVINRTPRYQNPEFRWDRVMSKYGKEAIFVGDPAEHRDFVNQFGSVPYYPTKTYLDLAMVIAGATLFVGNQSSPAAVAQGLRIPMIQESRPWGDIASNCHWHRPGMWHDSDFLPDLGWFEWMVVQSHTLLTPDRINALVKTVRDCTSVEGDLAELGVFCGGAALAMSRAAPHRRIHLFDQFGLGLPESEGGHHAGEFASPLGTAWNLLGSRSAVFHAGRFPETTRGLENLKFSVVHLDADLYSSTLAGIDYFWPRISPGGYLCFDDWGWESCPGVARAIVERFSADAVESLAPWQARIRKPY